MLHKSSTIITPTTLKEGAHDGKVARMVKQILLALVRILSKRTFGIISGLDGARTLN